MASPVIPTTMSGVIIGKTGGTEVLEYRTDLPVPQPKANELLIKVDHAGVNFIDTYFRTGLYPVPSFPYTLGREASGTVVAVGSSSDPAHLYGLHVGSRVTVYASSGAYAQYLAIPAAKAVAVPDGISLADAAAAPLQALTAWTMLHESHAVQTGDWILITAAAGGVGLWLVQMGKHLGARVIATCRGDEKVKVVREAGADVVIDYGKEEYVAKVLELTGGEGVVAVYDGVGKTTFDDCLKCVARKGTMVSFGNASGAVDPFNIRRLSEKNAKLLRPTLMNYLATREELERNSKDVWDFMLEGHIKVRIHKVYDLKDAAIAQQDLEGRKTMGKLLLKP